MFGQKIVAKESKCNQCLLWILRAVCKLGTNWLENCMNNDGEIFSIKFKPECCQNINAKLWPFKGCLGECWSWGFNLLMGCQPIRELLHRSGPHVHFGRSGGFNLFYGRPRLIRTLWDASAVDWNHVVHVVLTSIGSFNLLMGGLGRSGLLRRSGPRGALACFSLKTTRIEEFAQKKRNVSSKIFSKNFTKFEFWSKKIHAKRVFTRAEQNKMIGHS